MTTPIEPIDSSLSPKEKLEKRLVQMSKKHLNLPSPLDPLKKVNISSTQQLLLILFPPLHPQVLEELSRLVKNLDNVEGSPQFQVPMKLSDWPDFDPVVFQQILNDIGGDSNNTTTVGLEAVKARLARTLKFNDILTHLETQKTPAEVFGEDEETVTFDSYYHTIDDVLEDVERTWATVEALVEKNQLPKKGLGQLAQKFKKAVLGIFGKHASKGNFKGVAGSGAVTPVTPVTTTPITPTSLGWQTMDPILFGQVVENIRNWKSRVESGEAKVTGNGRFERALEILDQFEQSSDTRPKRKRKSSEPSEVLMEEKTVAPEAPEKKRKAKKLEKSPSPKPKQVQRRASKMDVKESSPIVLDVFDPTDPVILPPTTATSRQLILPRLLTQQNAPQLKRSLLPHLPDLIKHAKIVNVTGTKRVQDIPTHDDLHSSLASGRGVVEFEVPVESIEEDVWNSWIQLLRKPKRRESGWTSPTSPTFLEKPM